MTEKTQKKITRRIEKIQNSDGSVTEGLFDENNNQTSIDYFGSEDAAELEKLNINSNKKENDR